MYVLHVMLFVKGSGVHNIVSVCELEEQNCLLFVYLELKTAHLELKTALSCLILSVTQCVH